MYEFMAEFVQIEKAVLDEILDRIAYLRKIVITLYERAREQQPDDWLTTEQLCVLLHTSESKIRSLKRGGHIGFTKCGKKHLYLAEDFVNLLESVDSYE